MAVQISMLFTYDTLYERALARTVRKIVWCDHSLVHVRPPGLLQSLSMVTKKPPMVFYAFDRKRHAWHRVVLAW